MLTMGPCVGSGVGMAEAGVATRRPARATAARTMVARIRFTGSRSHEPMGGVAVSKVPSRGILRDTMVVRVRRRQAPGDTTAHRKA